ncbi:DUF3515 domain-containing protein [Actinokineospora auranticolor]|uniref:Uncharacterized protein DUF3515 n=1 Tax=Actinokineospora auranticolor TaxID=155976 RepID=A0A2S6GGK8_9PSEU|nr:DUF3515 domain-containing protein [Actinokineospora auranticolor]PPK64342.1 uncharacterized protein DUF3515 [Actinokineospora auranticolor]
MTEQTQHSPSRTAVVSGAVLAGLLVVGVVVASRFLPDEPAADAPRVHDGPVGLVPVDAPDAGAPQCGALLAALPDRLPNGDKPLARLPIAEPAPVGTMVWGDRVGDPVVLRCGLGKPPELTSTSALRDVSGVRWLPVDGEVSATWFAVDRGVYVALTMPNGVGTGPLQTVSEVVGRSLAVQEVRP